MSGCRALFQVHAGAVAMHGAGLLVCGPSGSGKTSLVIGLTGHGATILTDEVGLLQTDMGRPHSVEIDLIPFPRDLIVHRRTQQLFPRSAYGEEPCFKRFPEHCHLPPDRMDSASEPPASVPLTRLLFTSFQSGGGLALARLGPAEAARLLMLETFNLESLGARCTELLARVVESGPAWVIRYAAAVRASALVATFVIDDRS